MMELKVWVDGLQRVVCGVTTETTCQDVVIALAHAMGRTGRFTLIEKWRDVERPLTPGEYPLRVLHKWGEYATEVRLLLCESNVDKHKQRDRLNQPDKFMHNFSPPKTYADTSVKRNLTFSGAHNTTPRQSHTNHLGRHGLDNHASPRSSIHSSSSSVRSSSRPLPRQGSPANLTRVPPGHSPLLNGQVLPSRTNIVRPIPSRTNVFPGSQNLVRHGSPIPNSGFSSPTPHLNMSPSPRQVSPSPLRRHSPLTDLSKVTPVEHTLDSRYHERRSSSELEEYNLDMNFPDILRDSKQTNRQSAHMEYKLEESPESQPESEHTRLLRLVAQQTERLKVQESEIDVLETEILSLEQKETEFERNLKDITDDLVQLEQREHEDENELSELSTVTWVDVLKEEESVGERLKSSVRDLQNELNDLEKNLSSHRTRVSELEADITEAKLEREKKEKEAERKKKEEEENTRHEQSKVQDDLKVSKEVEDRKKKELEDVLKETSELEKCLKSKQEVYASLEEDLKKVNLEDFGTKSLSPTLGKPGDSGEAVLKILEGRLSPRPNTTPPNSNQQPFVSALASKNPNGVWV